MPNYIVQRYAAMPWS